MCFCHSGIAKSAKKKKVTPGVGAHVIVVHICTWVQLASSATSIHATRQHEYIKTKDVCKARGAMMHTSIIVVVVAIELATAVERDKRTGD
jgi:hypothetical protein